MRQKHFLLAIFLIVFGIGLALPAPAYAQNITPQKVTFLNGQGVTLDAWLFKPASGAIHPAIVMMHGCAGAFSFSDPTKGLSSLYLEWGKRLATAGYAALLVDSFTPRHVAQNLCNTGGTIVSEISDRPYDAYAAFSYLASQSYINANAIGLLGWSHGGSSTFASMDVTHYNASANFKAAVAFYPGCELYGSFGGLTNSTWKPYASFVILHGAADTTVSAANCQSRINQAKALGAANAGITIFAGAQHSFDLATSVSSGFTQADVNAKITADQQTMQFFGLHLQTLTNTSFQSVGTYDGDVLESAETSNIGGTSNSTSSILRVGDDKANRQYRSLLHFNTASLPDNAIVVSLKLKVKQQCMQGTNPFLALGGLQADIKKTRFGASTNLETGDFQSAASVSKAGLFDTTSVSGWYTVTLNTSAFAYIDPLGMTQFRLGFGKDDNNDHLANDICFYSGNSTTLMNRPVLIVLYYLP